MIVEGPAPPWEGGGRYGSWREVEYLWDGTRRWQWQAPGRGGAFLNLVSRILKERYMPVISETLSTDTLLMTLWGDE